MVAGIISEGIEAVVAAGHQGYGAACLAARPEATQGQLALYPNPAQDVLTISLATGSAAGHLAEVRDLLGRPVRTATLPASGQLNLAGLAAGSYLLTLDGTLTRRISKVD
ncbi:MAG: T9SS type A sorting domain-containing protein [Hymenobacter sp.]|nr:MAG: T9SS type A sorting domain-containing protein [Hymenobacter sp.]